jgi:hypothetical protein
VRGTNASGRNFAVATAELNGDRAVCLLFRGDVVERVSIERVLLEVAFCVVDADRPEGVHRHLAPSAAWAISPRDGNTAHTGTLSKTAPKIFFIN